MSECRNYLIGACLLVVGTWLMYRDFAANADSPVIPIRLLPVLVVAVAGYFFMLGGGYGRKPMGGNWVSLKRFLAYLLGAPLLVTGTLIAAFLVSIVPEVLRHDFGGLILPFIVLLLPLGPFIAYLGIRVLIAAGRIGT